ncbi:hypothetical protein CEXT_659421 [Caerostris extrusa]|uniref:Uncharacterized protein n=1 Tax=Caerostris extrusa TaxID=172846 RepID=A0AAV4M525_CAEEX|nr:hypothetical protein CEXT_659421 [Caerostris extrusa]
MCGSRINWLNEGLCVEKNISAFENKRRMNLLSDYVLRSTTDKKCHVTGMKSVDRAPQRLIRTRVAHIWLQFFSSQSCFYRKLKMVFSDAERISFWNEIGRCCSPVKISGFGNCTSAGRKDLFCSKFDKP